MKIHTILIICFSFFAIASSSFADEAAAPPALENPEATLNRIPSATDEQKEAMRRALDFLAIESFKRGPAYADLPEKDPDDLFRKGLESVVIVTDQILAGELKDKLPEFYFSEIRKARNRTFDFLEKSKNITNLIESPELKEFMIAEQKESALFDGYMKRETGKTLPEFVTQLILELSMKVEEIRNEYRCGRADYPALIALDHEIEDAKTDAEREDLEKALKKEIVEIALDEITKSKE